MTWKQQFGAIAFAMQFYELTTGVTENVFNEYGFDFFMRSKFI